MESSYPLSTVIALAYHAASSGTADETVEAIAVVSVALQLSNADRLAMIVEVATLSVEIANNGDRWLPDDENSDIEVAAQMITYFTRHLDQ
jgi:TPP-dependent trihydroxycyclohexane-1,2-dione (THcHDO) dehydratase